MRRVRRDHDQIPGLQEIFLTIAQAARFTVDNRPHRELRVAVAFVGLAAAPGAAQLQPRQTIVSPEGLGNISGMVHCFGLCCGDKPFIACCAEAVARLDLRTASKKDVTLAVRGNMFS